MSERLRFFGVDPRAPVTLRVENMFSHQSVIVLLHDGQETRYCVPARGEISLDLVAEAVMHGRWAGGESCVITEATCLENGRRCELLRGSIPLDLLVSQTGVKA